MLVILIFIFYSIAANGEFRFLGYGKNYDLNRKYSMSIKNHNETNDCTVKALAFGLNKSYDEAHLQMKELGRVNRKSIVFKNIANNIKEIREIEGYNDVRLWTFLKENKNGIFLILTYGHIFVVKDGKVYDGGIKRGSRKIIKVYEVE